MILSRSFKRFCDKFQPARVWVGREIFRTHKPSVSSRPYDQSWKTRLGGIDVTPCEGPRS
jgi:hypothetical protein